MDDDDIFLIESVAHEIMTRLGYKPQIVGVTSDAMVFTDENIAEFKVLNEEGIKKMNADLAGKNAICNLFLFMKRSLVTDLHHVPFHS